MKPTPRALRNWTITYSKSELVAVSLIAAVVAGWAALAGGSFSIGTLVACEALFLAFYLTGSLVASLPRVASEVSFGLPLRLLFGYAVVNTALLGLAWLSPLGIVANFCAVLTLVAVLGFAAGERKQIPTESANLWVVALCLVATSLWCQDSLQPRTVQGDTVVFKPWVDGFYHAVQLRIFGASHGAASLEDWRLAGVPARPYHYGMYLTPAFIKQASGMASYPAFAGILAPVGVFFTGLGAYAFFASLWGAWPGLAAAAALLLLPDGAQQGMQNPFMSYHWLTQISPSATHGLALLAVAWLFVIRGCTRGSRAQLFTGWAFATSVLGYKLHYFVASALLLLLVPALFFRAKLGVRRRALWVVGACVTYAIALHVGAKVPGVPRIVFDGSSAGEILRLVLTFARPGVLRDHAVQHMGPHFSMTSNLLFGVPYVLLSAFGVLLPLLVALALWLRRRTAPLYVLFPLLLIGNFLLMFFGLALDFTSSTPDELSHRPIMIVYFFSVAWLGGALGLTLGKSARLSRWAPPITLGLAAMLMLVPARCGAGVQKMWAMPQMSPVRVPVPLVQVADYIREHGPASDVFQDSQFDRIYVLAALSERRTFVAHTMTLMPFRAETVEARTTTVDRFMRTRQPGVISATARAFRFRWFVLHPGDRVAWPSDIANQPALEAGPFKLYEF